MHQTTILFFMPPHMTHIHLILIWDVKKQSFSYWIFAMPSEGGGGKREGIILRFHILRAGRGLQEKGVVYIQCKNKNEQHVVQCTTLYNMLFILINIPNALQWRARVRVTRKGDHVQHVGEVYSGSLPATLPLQPLTPSTSQRLVLLTTTARLYKNRLTWT